MNTYLLIASVILAFDCGVVIAFYLRERSKLRRAETLIDDLAPMMGFVLAIVNTKEYVPPELRRLAVTTVPTWLADIDARAPVNPSEWVH